MKIWIQSFVVLFFIPVAAVIFFHFAPKLEERRVKSSAQDAIQKETRLSHENKSQRLELLNQLQIKEMCSSSSQAIRQQASEMGLQSVCDDFQHFLWAQWLGFALIALGCVHLLSSYGMSVAAGKSQQNLLAMFHLAWSSSTVIAMMTLMGQTLLAGYACFYLTVLTTGYYSVKLIGVIILGGLAAFYQIVQLLFARMPLESEEKTSEPVAAHEAPALWEAVHKVAATLQTTPPDHILVGMSDAFFVTELPVHHARGVSRGRILHLSAPMMQQMPLNEVLAIIGHELGHFKGKDTQLTRSLSPRLVKADRVMNHMENAGLMGWPALIVMGIFKHFFESAIGAYRRDREFAADACCVMVTNEQTAASALLRYMYQSESYQAAMHSHLREKGRFEDALLKFQNQLKVTPHFWESMGKISVPHPYDSHPPLTARLQKLGYNIDQLKTAITEPVAESAYHVFFTANSEVLQHARAKHDALIQHVQEQNELETAGTDSESQALLEKHFPTVILKTKLGTIWIYTALCFILVSLIPLCAFVFSHSKWAYGAGSLGIVFSAWLSWRLFENYKNLTLTLTAEGIQLSNWARMLRFSDVTNIRRVAQSGSDQLIFDVRQKMPPITKSVWFPYQRKFFGVEISYFNGSNEEIILMICRYYARKHKPHSNVNGAA